MENLWKNRRKSMDNTTKKANPLKNLRKVWQVGKSFSDSKNFLYLCPSFLEGMLF